MDSSILQLFIVEEILERIGQRKLSGCFHVFAPKESANLFFTDGIVVAAVNGKISGEVVVYQVLDWKTARYFWEPNAANPTTPTRPLKIDICELMAKMKTPEPVPLQVKTAMQIAAEKAAERAALARTSPGPLPAITAPSRSVIPIVSKGKSTSQIPQPALPATAPVPKEARPASTPIDLAATKTIDAAAEARSFQDEALLAKFKFVLVGKEHPQNYKLTRIKNITGRNQACDISILHPSISRQHCLLQITERGLHVKDLDTTNGTKVNGIAMKEGYISVGDKLTMGHLTFALERE